MFDVSLLMHNIQTCWWPHVKTKSRDLCFGSDLFVDVACKIAAFQLFLDSLAFFIFWVNRTHYVFPFFLLLLIPNERPWLCTRSGYGCCFWFINSVFDLVNIFIHLIILKDCVIDAFLLPYFLNCLITTYFALELACVAHRWFVFTPCLWLIMICFRL